MKTILATALILAAGATQAVSFDHEKAIGSADLFSTLATDSAITIDGSGDGFAYQSAIGSADLFPSLIKGDSRAQRGVGSTVFDYQRVAGEELDPSLS
jgi:hypothetical protein